MVGWKRALRVLGVAGAGFSLTWTLGCGAPAPTFDLLLLTIDTLRADRWGCLGDPRARTPVMDRLSRGGTLAFEGRAPTPLTLPSHTSILTGLPPAVHGVRDNGIFQLPEDQGRTLAEACRELGYSTAAFVSALPLMKVSGLGRGFDVYDDRLRRDEELYGSLRERTADRTVQRAVRWMRSDAPPDAPLLLWVHLFDPHAAYVAPPPYGRIPGLDPYGAEVAFVDEEVGRLLRAMSTARSRGLAIVATSDHGESLGAHGESTHGVLIHTATMRVPIVVRTPEYAPRLSSRVVSLERVAATILELAGSRSTLNPGAAPALDAPEVPVHSESLYAHFNFGWRGLRAREEDGWRLIVGETERLYHVARDPSELDDRSRFEPERVAQMRDDLEDAWDGFAEDAFAVAPRELDEAEVEALESIGYLSAVPAQLVSREVFLEGPGPEGRLPIVELVNLGVTHLSEGRDREAAEVLERVVNADPENRLAFEYLGRAYRNLRSFRQARDAFGKAIALGRNPAMVHIDYALACIELGEPSLGWKALEEALRIQPGSALARQAMAEILVAEGRPAEAIPLLEEAMQLRPRAPRSYLFLGMVYEALGRPHDAAAAWQRVVELDPDGSNGHLAQGALQELRRKGGSVR